MKKSQRLRLIVDLNEENEKKALEEMGVWQKKIQDVKTQLDNLRQYQQEYKNQYQALSQSAINIDQLLEFRAFTSKISKAIEEQEKAFVDINEKATSVRKVWERQHQKTQSLQKVCESALVTEIKEEDKREQKEQDDRSSRMARNSGTGSANY